MTGENNDVTPLKPKSAFAESYSAQVDEIERSRFCIFVQKNKQAISWFVVLAVIAAVIAIVVVATRKDEDSEPPYPPYPIVDFSTGISLITHYAIDATVRSRLATTKLAMTVKNGLNCSSIHMVTLQLPLQTRVTSLKTIADNGCTTTGKVQKIGEARETFLEQSSQGLPSAYVEVQDSFTYSLQVSIPPMGVTDVELVVEQLLQQRLGEVAFEIPMIPNEEVDKVKFDLSVEDVEGNPVEFDVDLYVKGLFGSKPGASVTFANANPNANATNSQSSSSMRKEPVKLDIQDARQHDLPQVVRGKFKPNEVPKDGYLYTDGTCFEHYFLPASEEPMPRNIFFLLDTSESMDDDDKLKKAKIALMNFIDTLGPRDSFTIQNFAGKGTVDLWGVNPATEEEKVDAKNFVNKTKAERGRGTWGTDLHEALIEAMIRANDDLEEIQDDTVTILVLISDAWASVGETNRAKIAKHVFDNNRDGAIKIFPLGFHGEADMQLLDAIALMNGGVSKSIRRGEDDYSSQIITFLGSELGKVLLSDVSVEIQGEKVKMLGETKKIYPILAEGYEVVVRGLIEVSSARNVDAPIKAVTKAASMKSIQSWEIATAIDLSDSVKSSLCFQSYAHARISQLVRMKEAANFLGNDIVKSLITLVDSDCQEEDFAKCIEAEALDLAVRGNIVAKGLTAMVTVDGDKCMGVDDGAEICLDGTTPDGSDEVYQPKYGESAGDVEATSAAPYDYSYEYGYPDYPEPMSGALDTASTFLLFLTMPAAFVFVMFM